MLEQIPDTPVPIEKNVINALGNIVPNPINDPYNAALEAADKIFRITNTTSPETPVQYRAYKGTAIKKNALYPRLSSTFPLRDNKDVLTRTNIPSKEAANVGIVSNCEILLLGNLF